MINIAYRCFVVVTFIAQSFSSGGNLNCAVSGGHSLGGCYLGVFRLTD